MPRRRAGPSRPAARPRNNSQRLAFLIERRPGRQRMIRSIAIAVATFAGVSVAAADTRVTYFPVPSGGQPARCGAGAGRHRSSTPAQGSGHLGRLDPQTGKDENSPDRFGLGAAWRHRRPGRRGLDHRRRPERQCALRSEDQGDQRLSAAAGLPQRQSQHRRVRQERRLLVHRPERRARLRQSEDRQERELEVAAAAAPTASR